jgi:hypothetical protein
MRFSSIALLLSCPLIFMGLKLSFPSPEETYTKYEAHGIFRPVDDGTGATKWEFVQDASHYGPLFLGEPYIVGNAVKADFNEQVNIFSGHLTHDGQLASFPPGLSINTTGISFRIWELREPMLRIQLRLNDGTVTSWTETPTDSTGFDVLAVIQNGNEFEINFMLHSYLGTPEINPPAGYKAGYIYPGSAADPNTVKFALFDNQGNAVNTLPNNFRVMIERRVDMEQKRVAVNPTDPRLHQINAANYWFSGDFLSRD